MTTTADREAKRRRRTPLLALSATVHQHEAVRAAIRAGLATGLAYGVSMLLGVPDKTWAVISALYVLQTSVGGTVNMAIGRVMGAGLGVVLGLAAVVVAGSTEWLDLVALLLVVGAIGAIGEVKPELRFGAVVAAILLISPGASNVLEDALQKAYAIALGSAIGALVGAFVFPVAAHRSARNHLAAAVRHCGSLVALAFEPETQSGNKEWVERHEAVERELATTRDRLGQSRWIRRAHDGKHRSMLMGVDRFWHHLSMFDRMVSGGERQPGREQQDLLARTREASCAYMDRLADAIARGSASGADLEQSRRQLEDVSKRWDEFVAGAAGEGLMTKDKQLEIVAFGWRQLRREMEHLAETLQEERGGKSKDA